MQSYSKGTLNGNWLEERWAPDQACRKYNDERFKRHDEEALNSYDASGVPHALGRINRTYKWDTNGVVADDGFREMYTINNTEIQNPERVRQTNPRPHSTCGPRMVNKKNLQSVLATDRELPGYKSGWASRIPGEPPKPHEMTTTTQSQFGFGIKREETLTYRLPGAGTVQRQDFAEFAEVEKPNVLTAEKFRDCRDNPQNDTTAQRTWINYQDPGMKVRAYAQTNSKMPEKDNEKSLPIGKGEYHNIKVSGEAGQFRRIRCDATSYPREHLHMNFR